MTSPSKVGDRFVWVEDLMHGVITSLDNDRANIELTFDSPPCHSWFTRAPIQSIAHLTVERDAS